MKEVIATVNVNQYLKESLEKLIEFTKLVKECPENALHLMPLAADALLSELQKTRQASKNRDS